MKLNDKTIIVILFLALLLISLVTVPFDILDATDVKDYSDTAKFFAGEYSAKIRTSHSVAYGLLLSPYIKITESFFALKFVNAILTLLLILSVYYVSGKNRKTLILFAASPLIWYMSPWLSPLHLVTISIIWSYFFLKRYEEKNKISNLIISGILAGLAGTLWETAIYISLIFLLAFFYNKKLYCGIIFLIGVFVGLIPSFILNQIFYGLPIYSILKHASAVAAFALYGGSYAQGYSTGWLSYFLILLFVPTLFYTFYKKKIFLNNRGELIFITMSLLFVLSNPQVRLLFFIAPFIFLLLGENLSKKQFKIQISILIILSILVLVPYAVQTNYQTNARYLEIGVKQFPNIEFKENFDGKLISDDLSKITSIYPNETFLVGNERDSYRELAHFYWGSNVKEFVSLEDYQLFLDGSNTIIQKEIRSKAKIAERREFWLSVGLDKSSNDDTDYESIEYALSFEESFVLENFEYVESYEILHLFKKIENQ